VYFARLPPAPLLIFISPNVQRLERWKAAQPADLCFLTLFRIAEPHHPVQHLLRALTLFPFAPEDFTRSIRRLNDFWRVIRCISHSIQCCHTRMFRLRGALACRGRRGGLFLRRSW